jgi:excisionase family DNA binding protein
MMEELNPKARGDDRDRTAPSEKPSQRLTASVEEAAELLGIARGHAYSLVSRGEIPSLRLGRGVVFQLVALRRLLTKRIGYNPDPSQYRTEKAGAVPTAAIRLQRDALLGYAAGPRTTPMSTPYSPPPVCSTTLPIMCGRQCGRQCAPPKASPRPPACPEQ